MKKTESDIWEDIKLFKRDLEKLREDLSKVTKVKEKYIIQSRIDVLEALLEYAKELTGDN